jgi:hypothetical protein
MPTNDFSRFCCQRNGCARSKLAHEKVIADLQHVAEGCGIRQTARLVGVNTGSITRLALLADGHAEAIHDELLASSPLHPRGPVR